jgi:hypothetical protein
MGKTTKKEPWFQTLPGMITSVTALVTALGGFAVSIRSCELWPQADCRRTSREGGQAMNVEFVNRSHRVVRVTWVDFQGIEQDQEGGTLGPEAIFKTKTYTGHAWCVRNRDTNRAILAPIIDANSKTVIIN